MTHANNPTITVSDYLACHAKGYRDPKAKREAAE
jgi:hypothetical protein